MDRGAWQATIHGVAKKLDTTHWSGLSFPPPRDISHPGIKPASLEAPALARGFFTTEPTGNKKELQKRKNPTSKLKYMIKAEDQPLNTLL